MLGIGFFLSATVHMIMMYWAYVDVFLRGIVNPNPTAL